MVKSAELSDQHHHPAVEAVKDRPREQPADKHWRGVGHGEPSQCLCRSGLLEHEPGEGDARHRIAEDGNRVSGPVPAEITRFEDFFIVGEVNSGHSHVI